MSRTVFNRILLFVFVLAASAGCAGGKNNNADNTFAPSGRILSVEDHDNKYNHPNSNIVETEDAYYYSAFSGFYTYYFDKTSGEYGVLCARPECVHDEIETNKGCNGYTALYCKSLNIWDDELHYISSEYGYKLPAVYSISLDGTVKRRGIEVDFGNGSPQRFDYHRGKLYGWGEETIIDNAEPKYSRFVFCLDPETGEIKKLYEETDSSRRYDFSFYYFEKFVYFSVANCSELTEKDYLGKTRLDIYRWNTETEEREPVFSTGSDRVSGQEFSIWVESERKIYIMAAAIAEGVPSQVYRISDGEISPVFEFGICGPSGMIEGAAICINVLERKAEIRTPEGDMIYEGDWDLDLGLEFDYETPPFIISGDGDRNALFITYAIQTPYKDEIGSCLIHYDLTRKQPKAKLIAYSPWD